MKRTLEAIFQRHIQLLILIILLPLMGLVVALLLPRSYQTTARLWAWHPIQDVTVASQGSSAANQEIDPQTQAPITPAQSQVNTLSQYLQTHDFDLAVAKRTALAARLGLDTNAQVIPQQRLNALFQDIFSHVKVSVLGGQSHNLFTVSYTNQDPQVAQQVVEAVIQLYDSQVRSFALIQGQKLLDPYQKQLADALLDADKVNKAIAQYILNHPSLTGDALLSDSQYQSLVNQVTREQSYISSIQSTIATLNQAISQNASPGSVFKVLDAPATQLLSRTTSFLIAGAVGLCIALLACVIYIFIVMRSDRAVYTAHDLQKVTALPVVTQLPHLSSETVPLLVNGSIQHERKKR